MKEVNNPTLEKKNETFPMFYLLTFCELLTSGPALRLHWETLKEYLETPSHSRQQTFKKDYSAYAVLDLVIIKSDSLKFNCINKKRTGHIKGNFLLSYYKGTKPKTKNLATRYIREFTFSLKDNTDFDLFWSNFSEISYPTDVYQEVEVLESNPEGT